MASNRSSDTAQPEFSEADLFRDASASFDVYLCDECGGMGIGALEMTCCGESMNPAAVDEPVEEPELVDVLRHIYGMNETELRICIMLMEEGSMTASEVADAIGCDSSFASRLLKHSLELGVIEKEEFLLDKGGRVAAYSHRSIPDVERRFKAELGAWMLAAFTVLEQDIVAEKEAMVSSARSMADTMTDEKSIYYNLD